jgi:hypothetical protein
MELDKWHRVLPGATVVSGSTSAVRSQMTTTPTPQVRLRLILNMPA